MDAKMEKEYVKGGSFLIEDRTAAEIFTPEDLDEEQRMIGEMLADEMGDASAKRVMNIGGWKTES